MAKIINPLHSLSASGTVGKIASFRATIGGAVCTRKARKYKTTTPLQEENKQRMRDARKAFLHLSTTDRIFWQQRATALKGAVWPIFFAEYQFQNVIAPAFPLIPEPYL